MSSSGRTVMAKITRTNPKTISRPFSNYAHVVTVESAKKLVFCACVYLKPKPGRIGDEVRREQGMT